METFRCVALLPMKAHSGRVPHKNFRSFAGKPLFRWILDTLLSLDEIERVIINTDARDILSTYGVVDSRRVVIRDRRLELQGDAVSMNLVLADDVSNVNSKCYLMTHATNPLLTAGTIRRAVGAFQEGVAAGRGDSLFSVNRFQTRFYRADGSAVNHDPGNLLRTQDLEPWFEENSNLYLFSRESFVATGARIGRRPMMFVTPQIESVDIDDEESWALGEALARSTLAVQQGAPRGASPSP
jgi:CMP-N-acetylneuraminic acid synthetase